MTDRSASVYSGIKIRSWPMTAPASQTGMPTKLRLRSALIMTGSLSGTWTAKPAMNTQTP
jgi:hypothetical protein